MSEFDRDPGAEEGVRVTDKRRIDPETGQVREQPAGVAAEVPPQPADEDARVTELTADLQRVTAEYANYRKRVDRDRQSINDLAAAAVVNELLPVLDDLGRAKEHGEFEGALKSVGEQLEATTTKLGLEAFGAVGDPFDPTVHEAMTHAEGEGLEVPQVSVVFAVGYTFRGRVLRPARVGVEE
ncbi:MAG: nucleotide exchange factor GrpE [Candidatus Nanopelagicales bacterium]